MVSHPHRQFVDLPAVERFEPTDSSQQERKLARVVETGFSDRDIH
jgi:hypothetical protein